jgi:2-polyprenyl-3-methyl-5-hydroxy-6-metoxy-1,4-benzoquinol methylase
MDLLLERCLHFDRNSSAGPIAHYLTPVIFCLLSISCFHGNDLRMEPHAFIAEVYRRMALRQKTAKPMPDWNATQNDRTVVLATEQYKPHLPSDKAARILDVGFGEGWFLAACLKLGYRNLTGADFAIANKDFVRGWAPDRITLYEIVDNIGQFLADKKEQYDFIHMSHVIEHIPKYSLLWIGDALYWAVKRGGTILLRTPNMEGPCANSSLYVTLAHEYGFAGANLVSLLDICGFDDIRLLDFRETNPTVKQRFGHLLRWPFLKESQIRHRLFGPNYGGKFGAELVVTAKRGNWPPFFDRRYK